MFKEAGVKINWVNRKLEDLNISLPTTFESLEQFKDGYLLECFLNLDKEAFNYETRALHFSAHIFFKKPEVKKALYALVSNFLIKINWKEKELQGSHGAIKKI